MARQARNYEDTDIFHTIVRGNNSELIFRNCGDKEKIVEIIYEKCSSGAFEIIAYCILCDHAHFIIKENTLSVAEAMKRINTSYAAYYNKKNSRRGHVFYSRYLSEAICSGEKLLNTIKYILNHPSMYEEKNRDSVLMTEAKDIFFEYYDYIISHLNLRGKEAAYEYFLNYINSESSCDCVLDLSNPDEEIMQAKKLLYKYFDLNDITLSCLMSRECLQLRTQMILYLKQNTNLSIRKIAEVLNLNRGIVYKIICENYKD